MAAKKRKLLKFHGDVYPLAALRRAAEDLGCASVSPKPSGRYFKVSVDPSAEDDFAERALIYANEKN